MLTRSYFRVLWWEMKRIHPVAGIPWSAIRRIGQSRLLALTIVVPFLGSLLLFNHHVFDVLTLSPELIQRWFGGTTEKEVQETARHVTLNRLYYVYFGLSILGIASSLFALFCPLEIKNYGSAREYLQVDGPLVTEARMGLIIPNLGLAFIRWAGTENTDQMNFTRQLAEPDEFVDLFCVVAKDLYVAESREEERWAKEHNEATAGDVREVAQQSDELIGIQQDPDAPPDFGPNVDDRGYPDPWKIAESLYMQRRVDGGFTYRINQLATTDKHRTDILTLQYMARDHSKPWLRLFVVSLYAFGFGLMLWPTGSTFLQLSTGLFTR